MSLVIQRSSPCEGTSPRILCNVLQRPGIWSGWRLVFCILEAYILAEVTVGCGGVTTFLLSLSVNSPHLPIG